MWLELWVGGVEVRQAVPLTRLRFLRQGKEVEFILHAVGRHKKAFFYFLFFALY